MSCFIIRITLLICFKIRRLPLLAVCVGGRRSVGTNAERGHVSIFERSASGALASRNDVTVKVCGGIWKKACKNFMKSLEGKLAAKQDLKVWGDWADVSLCSHHLPDTETDLIYLFLLWEFNQRLTFMLNYCSCFAVCHSRSRAAPLRMVLFIPFLKKLLNLSLFIWYNDIENTTEVQQRAVRKLLLSILEHTWIVGWTKRSNFKTSLWHLSIFLQFSVIF